MVDERLRKIIAGAQASSKPVIEFLKRSRITESQIGIFASSFNPLTNAHVQLMRRAIGAYRLDEVLALAGVANADKDSYECALEDRLAMLLLAFDKEPEISIGVSSHAYFVDVVEALEDQYPKQAEFYFVLGFDTFERVVDAEGRYVSRYHRGFQDRTEALRFLLAHSRLIVAGRAGATVREVEGVMRTEAPELADRVVNLTIPVDIAERSATEVRRLVRAGKSIAGLVPPEVETYIARRGIYQE